MGHTVYLQNNWLQIVFKFIAITGRKTVLHFDALIFFQGVK